MTTQPQYLRYLESAKQADTAERLRHEGYVVEEEKKVGDVVFDLVATRDGRTVVYEFKSAGYPRFDRDTLIALQDTARRAGYEFHIVVAMPPPRVHIEVETLQPHLKKHVMEHPPFELKQLSAHTRVLGVNDLEIADLRMKNDEIRVSGRGSIDIEIRERDGSDQNIFEDSCPFQFTARLKPTGELIEVEKLSVDTSSFYE